MQFLNGEAEQSYKHDRNEWKFGFTSSAELWNGRFAMIGIVIAILVNLLSGQGTLHFLGML